MYFLNSIIATQYLFESNPDGVVQSHVERLAECIENGVFTEEDIQDIFTEEIQERIRAEQGDVPVLEEAVVLKVTYQAEEYQFDVQVETFVDLREEAGRIPMAKLIGNELKQKINNSGEIIAIERA